MSYLKIPTEIKNKIINIAKEYNFQDIYFDEEYPFEGFRRNLASTKNSTHIIYRYLSLNPLQHFYKINKDLFEKATRVLTIHERTHHEPPFNSGPNVDDYIIQKRASEYYGNIKEMMFLDILTCQIMRTSLLMDDEIKTEVEEHSNKYFWVDNASKKNIQEILSRKRNYKKKNLIRILRQEKIL